MSAFLAKVVQEQTPDDRSERRAESVQDEPRFMARDHPDDEQVGDLRKRQQRGIEKRNQEQTGGAERQRKRFNPVDESPHTE